MTNARISQCAGGGVETESLRPGGKPDIQRGPGQNVSFEIMPIHEAGSDQIQLIRPMSKCTDYHFFMG